MSQPKQYSIAEVFQHASVGFVFEFYSSKDINFIIKDLSSLSTKSIILTNGNSYQPSFSTAILVQEYSGEKPRYSLKLGQQQYNSALPIAKAVLNWLSEWSECTRDTNMRVSLSFDHKRLDTIQTISTMNPHKLMLSFNESHVYDRFPSQRNSAYSLPIKHMMPLKETMYTNDLVKNINYIIGVPKEQYYGINFKDYTTGTLEFNYIGGENYCQKEQQIIEMLEYYVIKTYKSINDIDYTHQEVNDLREMTETFYKVQESYYDPAIFLESFPDIKVAINLRRDTQLIKSMWHIIRNNLFEAIINHKMKSGEFNYDGDNGRFQIRNATLECSGLSNFDLIKCKIKGVVTDCFIWMSEINGARVYRSNIVKGNDVQTSYLKNVTIERENSLSECFVENNDEIINCNIKKSIIKFAGIGKFARLDESSVIIAKTDLSKPIAKGIEVEEIRDYKWMSNLTKDHTVTTSFGNEYIKKRFV